VTTKEITVFILKQIASLGYIMAFVLGVFAALFYMEDQLDKKTVHINNKIYRCDLKL
jgi:hypothetical protein